MESTINKRMREKLHERGIYVYRIESHATSPGIPDDHYVGRKFSGWIEVKQEQHIPRRIAYRPKQPQWLVNYDKRGGICWTALHIVSTDTLILVPGSWSEVADRALVDAQGVVIELRDGEKAWDFLGRILATGFAKVGNLGWLLGKGV